MKWSRLVDEMKIFVNVCDEFFFFQAEDGIRDLVRSRGLGDVYKRQYSKSPPKGIPVESRVILISLSLSNSQR